MALLNDSGSYTWTIDRKLSNSKVGDKYQSDIFTLANYLRCRIKLYPNGNKQQFEGYSMVFLRFLSMPTHWKYVTIRKTIESLQTKSQETNIGVYKTGDSAGWKYVLPFNEIKNELLLEIKINIKILRIHLKNDSIYYQYKLLYQKQLQITYKMSHFMIKRLKNCKPGKMVESNIFASMWCIRISPNGNNPENNGKCNIGLTLCSLPQNVSKLKVRWNLSCQEMNICISQISEFDVNATTKGCNIGTFEQFGKLKGLLLVFDINILKEYDNNGHDINEQEQEQKMSLKEAKTDVVISQNNMDKQLLTIYDDKLNAMTENMEITNDKLQKLTNLVIKTLEINKKKDEMIKSMNYKINTLQQEIERLKENNNERELSSQETLKLFLSKETELSEYFDLFIQNGFESLESLSNVTINDLQQIGITKIGHRQKMYKYIRNSIDSLPDFYNESSTSYKYT